MLDLLLCVCGLCMPANLLSVFFSLYSPNNIASVLAKGNNSFIFIPFIWSSNNSLLLMFQAKPLGLETYLLQMKRILANN